MLDSNISIVAFSIKSFNLLTRALLPFRLKVILSTIAFTAFELPPNGAIGTKILVFLFHARPDLVSTLFRSISLICITLMEILNPNLFWLSDFMS